MSFYSTHGWIVFVKTNERLSFIAYTSGELGIPRHMRHTTQEQMKKIREKEFAKSAAHFHAASYLFQFPDLHLSAVDDITLCQPLIDIIRTQNVTTILSFHPYELMPFVDHPDHTRVGQIARLAATAADVEGFFPNIPALSYRPHYEVLSEQGTQQYPVSQELKNKRIEHCATYYPSQFNPDNSTAWTAVMDQFTLEKYRIIR